MSEQRGQAEYAEVCIQRSPQASSLVTCADLRQKARIYSQTTSGFFPPFYAATKKGGPPGGH